MTFCDLGQFICQVDFEIFAAIRDFHTWGSFELFEAAFNLAVFCHEAKVTAINQALELRCKLFESSDVKVAVTNAGYDDRIEAPVYMLRRICSAYLLEAFNRCLSFHVAFKNTRQSSNSVIEIEFVPQAIKRVKGALLTRAIFLAEKMEIPESEIDQEIEAVSKMYQQYPDMLKNLKTPEYRDYVRNMIGNSKVIDFLKAICVVRTNPEHKC